MTDEGLDSRRPRVLHVYKDYYPPIMGGVEATINLLAEGCRERFETSVLVNSGSSRSYDEMINGVRVVKVAEWGRAASAPFSPAFVGALARESRGVDILHFHHPNPTGDLARFLARPRPPAVMTYHSDVVRQKRAMMVYGPLQRWMMGHCRVIMPTSPNYLESSVWLQEFRDKCEVVPLGIRIEEFATTDTMRMAAATLRSKFTRPVILFVGRLRYYKGLQYLVEAMASIDAELVLAGTGPVGEELRNQAAGLGVADRVHFSGDVSDAEKLAWYHAADVFCMPSHLRSEAFGISQVEAMASGLPVVSTLINSGVPFVNRDGECGLSVAPEDPAALAGAINRLLNDGELRQRLAQGAYERATNCFSAARMCENVMGIYDQVLAGRRA